MKQRTIVDLLPDREALTVQNWLSNRPYIKIVSRDRYSHYAKGITHGLPNAIQVADRWHLIKNLGDALQKVLLRTRQELRRRNKDAVLRAGNKSAKRTKEFSSGDKTRPLESLSQRDMLLQQIKELHQKGVPIRQIAPMLHTSRVTVRKYLRLQEAPRRNEGRTNIYQFLGYIQKRMQEVEGIELIQLWKEIADKGYNGSRATFYHHLKNYVKPAERSKQPRLNDVSWLPSDISLLLYRKEHVLTSKEKRLLRTLKKKSANINEVAMLVAEFRNILENKEGHKLRPWIDSVNRSNLPELKGFANGLLNDFQAVRNAFELPWSNGQVEGQINKLKTVKRQMYGRASFHLLRKRMILGYG